MRIRLIISIGLLSLITSCGPYSFTGVSTTAETISIKPFANNADLGPANLSQTFTNSLKDYFQQNSSLSVVQGNGELEMEGIVSDYTVTQVAPTASGNPNGINTAALSRLTIIVKVTYLDPKNELMSFQDKAFSFYSDFDNDQNLSEVEDRLIRTIFDQIILNIFNATVANW